MQSDNKMFDSLGDPHLHPVALINIATRQAIGNFRHSWQRAHPAKTLRQSVDDFVPFYMDTICLLAEFLKEEGNANVE